MKAPFHLPEIKQPVAPTLVTERLVLRHVRPSDIHYFAETHADPEVMRFVGGPVSREDAWRRAMTGAGFWGVLGIGLWAVEQQSAQWLDIGREFTEVWHHGSQVREAVGAGSFRDPSWLRDVLQISMYALPHAYRAVQPPHEDMSVVIEISGRAPGVWTLRRAGPAWDIDEGATSTPAATIAMTDETAWRLFFNALSPKEAQSSIALGGNLDLARPILNARAVIV